MNRELRIASQHMCACNAAFYTHKLDCEALVACEVCNSLIDEVTLATEFYQKLRVDFEKSAL